DHPLGAIAGVLERGHHLEALRDLLPARFAGRLLHLLAQIDEQLVDVELLQEFADRLGAHRRTEGIRAVFFVKLAVAGLREELALLERGLAGIHDDVRLEVENLLELLERHVEEGSDPRRQALQEPDVRHRGSEVDVPHALATDLRLDDLHAALLADHPPVPHALVLPAVALVVLGGTEDLGAEESIPFGLEGAVVDRFRLLHLTMRPRSDLVGRGERDANGVEDERIFRFFEETEEVFHHWAISPAGPSALLSVLGELDVEFKDLLLYHQ